jgi:2-methylisocitrate lyase-like PEP mutase family enzyme
MISEAMNQHERTGQGVPPYKEPDTRSRVDAPRSSCAGTVEKASHFAALHHGPEFLVLPNAWDVASARIFEAAGFPAIATTSAGVAFSLGYADREQIPRTEMISAIARIARAVSVPVTADVEAGYGDPVETAKQVCAAGAIGMNLEDAATESPESLRAIATQTAIIREIRALNLPLVVNARTDIFLAHIGDPVTQFARAVERLNAYREAGAHCLFAPGVLDAATIGDLVREVNGPLNILATAGVPDIRELQRLGVARVSLGSGPMRAAFGFARRMAEEIRDHGTYRTMLEGQIPYAEMNRLLAGSNK